MRKTGSLEALERYRKRGQRRQDADGRRVMQQFPALASSKSAAELVLVTTPTIPTQAGPPATQALLQRERKAFGAPKSLFASSFDDLGGISDLLAARAADRIEASAEAKVRRGKKLALAHRRRRGQYSQRCRGHGESEDEDEGEMTKLKPMESALNKMRDVAEKLLEAQQMDLRGFEGEVMDETTFRRALKTQLGVTLTSAETTALVRHMDENEDGHIDFKEVLHHLLNPERLRGTARRVFRRRTAVDRFRLTMDRIRTAAAGVKLEDVFRQFDEDGDQRISQQEFTEVLQDGLQLQVSDADVAEIFRYFDPNGDGSLSFPEFAFAYYNRRNFEKSIAKAQGGSKLRARRRTRAPFLP